MPWKRLSAVGVVAATLLLLGSLSTIYSNDATEASQEDKRTPPHILLVLIDDLGWGDVGFHQPRDGDDDDWSSVDQDGRKRRRRRREAQTPVMDRLAQKEGLELNRHYVHCSCTGTRTALQSGRFPVHVQTSLKNPEDPSSGMPRNLTGLAEHLKKSSYATHYVGKWDVGMATEKHTPKGRGYDTSLNYFEHKNDYWTQACMQSACCRHHLKEERQGKEKTKPTNETIIYDLWDTDKPARNLVGTDYEEFIFQRRMFEIIDNHPAGTNKLQHAATDDKEEQPLFLFYAPHVAHCPLQVPQSYLDQFDFIDNDETMCKAQTDNINNNNKTAAPYSCRKQYHAMIKLLDDILGSLVDRLKEKGLWDNTLMVVTSDNGGPVDPEESGATNFPLRGGKYSDWEGGVRATAFVSGGYIPEERRGKIVRHPIHIADWYATLPALAGIHVDDAEGMSRLDDKRIPPIDAVNIWPLIVGEHDKDDIDNYYPNDGVDRIDTFPSNASPRREIPLSKYALIVGEYKLIWSANKNISRAGWTGPIYPNANTKPREIDDQSIDCSSGCLFNVEKDPGEHTDVASSNPIRLQSMKKRLTALRQGFFENDDRGVDACPKGYNDDDNSLLCACWAAVNYYGGFFGPYQEVDLLATTTLSQK